MKQKKPPRDGAKSNPNQTAPKQRQAAAAKSQAGGWGWRWHAGHFRTALLLIVAAIGIVVTFGQANGALAHWYLSDGYVATRATIVKAPYWADALDPQPDSFGAIAGWHVDLRVGERPFELAVALTDFDPDKNYVDQKIAPDATRFAVGSVHPVWFYADNRKKQPESVSFLQSTPTLLISRTAFSRFPSLGEAVGNSGELLIAPVLGLSLAVLYLMASFFGKRGGNTAGAPPSARISYAIFACMVAGGAYLVNSEHPLFTQDEQYTPAEIEITRAPFPQDALSNYSGYRLLWRTWLVEAKLARPDAQVFTIEADGLDPRRQPWVSRHSPDGAALQAGTKLPVWQSAFYSSSLSNLDSQKQRVSWQTFLSRERWPDKYTTRHFISDNPIATALIAVMLLVAVIWLLPLGGRQQQ
jgi:hypothetical protein